ncbi:MAG TPA: cytochrome c3 family protein [Thermodesulfobacteriota bacterium]|nr:cytochrome c3 family protein [Thermodesulfobacteriota bacterium]
MGKHGGAVNRPKRIIFIFFALAVLGITTLYGAREIEKHDGFCGSCHVSDHELKYSQSVEDTPETLSAYHGTDEDVRCIDCHGYDSFFGRVETMWLAVTSLFRYITGNFHDPSITTEPIRDLNCVKCHSPARPHQGGVDDFHGRLDHVELSTACVDCHKGHLAGLAEFSFLVRAEVLGQCRECHPER